MIYFRELLENVVAVKPKRLSPKEQEELTLLLIGKDKELKETLQVKWWSGYSEFNQRSLELDSTKDKCLKACGRWAAWMVQILISFREGCKKGKENHLLLKMQWNNKTWKIQHQGYLKVILGTISRAPSPVHIINPCVFASTVSFHL